MAYNKLFTLTGHSQHRNLKTVDRTINCHNADDTIDCDTGGNLFNVKYCKDPVFKSFRTKETIYAKAVEMRA
ncbi:hypothetical protein L596_030697 [Steinernema carpocapsae]|uniref:Uncharacterized protein n=1 Tax=Steinernema carpocapsae TaxID=34508 RepID=A0A4U5LNJ7_STECR|nr:hypothetical protein L596_030697 [Steinernema carpocapsae]